MDEPLRPGIDFPLTHEMYSSRGIRCAEVRGGFPGTDMGGGEDAAACSSHDLAPVLLTFERSAEALRRGEAPVPLGKTPPLKADTPYVNSGYGVSGFSRTTIAACPASRARWLSS